VTHGVKIERCVFASGNPGKLREVVRILGEAGVAVVAQSEFGVAAVEETGTSFVENALLKAKHAVRMSGLPALADDSGLEVDALDGAPGVHSARYAGADANDEDNIAKLLSELEHVADDERGATFRCAVALVCPEQTAPPLIEEGVWRGSILRAPKGAGGFGYDPVFLDPQSGLSAAELSPEQKNQRSHRGLALKKLAASLRP
jgi:XTP/dITP diphosphohydrolase